MFRGVEGEGPEPVVVGAMGMVEQQLPRLDHHTPSVKKDDKRLSLLNWRT